MRKLLAVLLTASLLLPCAPAQEPKHAMVVTMQHYASDAGLQILKQGGNAVDAAVAVGFALAVVLPAAGNIGGGGFMLYRDHFGAAHFIDFRERAPLAANAAMFQDAQGNIVPGLSTLGYKAIGVPGTVAGLAYAQQHYGKLTLAQDMAPAIALATNGFVLSAEEARFMHAKNLSQFPESVRIFQRGGNFYAAGETFKQPDLARTLTTLSQHPEDFYRGKIAEQLAKSVQSHGGLITTQDLADYKVIDRQPLAGQFRAGGREDAQTYDIITSPPPSSGGIALLETLNILDTPLTYAQWAHLPDRSVTQVHYITEAFRRAYMDRADYLGDPDYAQIPLAEMASEKYASAWAASIQPEKATASADLKRPAGFLPPPPALKPQSHESSQTTHLSIVDEDGNAVAMTYTLNGIFGCGATADGLGFLLNNEMDDFSSKPGAPNMFGLIQSPANAIAPGHRPLSSMTPTIVTTHATSGHPAELRLILGSPGGPTIITTVANDLISTLVNGLTIQQAVDAPRFHHQYLPDTLDLEKRFDRDTAAKLTAMGYSIDQAQANDKNSGVWGDSELIEVNPVTHALEGGHDLRHTFGSVASY
jgi:gamma-glutamyltranspeptidase/glutathione hydrolase